MPFQKGHKLSGSRKNVPNKTTKDVREAYKELVEQNTENMSKWLGRVALTDPGKAIDLMVKLSEYFIPKLARTEHAGDKNNPVVFTGITILPPNAPSDSPDGKAA